MSRKPLSLRSTVVLAVASALGALAGDLSQTVLTELGHPADGAGHLTSILVGIWVAGKLHALREGIRSGRDRPRRRRARSASRRQ